MSATIVRVRSLQGVRSAASPSERTSAQGRSLILSGKGASASSRRGFLGALEAWVGGKVLQLAGGLALQYGAGQMGWFGWTPATTVVGQFMAWMEGPTLAATLGTGLAYAAGAVGVAYGGYKVVQKATGWKGFEWVSRLEDKAQSSWDSWWKGDSASERADRTIKGGQELVGDFKRIIERQDERIREHESRTKQASQGAERCEEKAIKVEKRVSQAELKASNVTADIDELETAISLLGEEVEQGLEEAAVALSALGVKVKVVGGRLQIVG